MERKYVIWGATIGIIVTLAVIIPKSFSINEKVKSCFNQFQWSEVDKSTKDRLDFTFFVDQVAVDHVGAVNIKCSLEKLGFDASTFGKALKPGSGTLHSGNYYFRWSSEFSCYGSFMVVCVGDQKALKVTGALLEVKSP